MNAWGVVVIVLGGAVLYWADKHLGSLGDLAGIGAAVAGTAAASSILGKGKTTNQNADSAAVESDAALEDTAAAL